MENSLEQENYLTVAVIRFCFYLTMISNLVIYIALPFQLILLDQLASRCFMFCNLISFFVAINHSMKQYVKYKTAQIVTIFFILCFSFISFLLSSNGGFYNYITRLLCFLALPFYFLYIDYLKPDKKMINFIFLINFLISILFILLSLSKYSYAGYEAYLGTEYAWLTLGYDNPNQTAMYLLVTIIIFFCAMNYYLNKIIKAVILLDILYLSKLLLDTSSRTCILIGLLIAITALMKKSYTLSSYIVIGILLLPAIFMFLYPFVYEHQWIYLFEYGGKSDYSSRSDIFRSVLLTVKDRFLFGDFGTYQLKNLHNGTLSIYSSLGIVGLVIFYVYFFRAYLYIHANGFKCRAAFIAFLGLLAIFVHSCTESAFMIGGSMYAGTYSILLFLVKSDGKKVA